MKQAILVAVALVIGIVLGGLGPRAQVRDLREQVAALEAKAPRRLGTEIASVLGAGRLDPPPDRYEPPPVPDDATEADPAEEPFEDDGVEVRFGEAEGDPPDAEASLGAMREALELRRVQARAALLEDADPDDEQLAEIDGAIDQMNDRLMELGRDVVADVREHGEPSRRDAMLFAADALDILITAEDSMAAALDEAQRDALGEDSLDPFSYVDPALLDLLAELDR